MKSGMSFVAFFCGLILFTVGILSSCKKENDDVENSGYATISGRTVDFQQAILEYTGVLNSSSSVVYGYSITLASSGINYDAQTGAGHIITFDLHSPTESMGIGTYNYLGDNYVDGAYVLTAGFFSINADLVNQRAEKLYYLTGGSILVSTSGGKYNISFNAMAQELSTATFDTVGVPQELVGSYEGSTVYYDVSEQKTLLSKFDWAFE